MELSRLREYARNPRRIGAERLDALKRSLTKDPDMLEARPLIALPDGRVICGNMRLRAAQELGWQTIPTLYVELDDVRARTWVLRDNNGYGEWDTDLLPEFLAELATDGVELELTGFAPEFLDDLLRPLAQAARDPDEAPELPAEPKSRQGELYELGPHRLMCGDATKTEDLTLLMGGEQADCIWTDPPYGVSYVGGTKKALTIRGDAGDASALVRTSFENALAVVVAGAPFYCAGPAGPRMPAYAQSLVDAGWRLHQELVWVKDVFVLGHSDYHYQHEPIFYGYAPGRGRPGRGNHEGTHWHGDHSQSSVLNFDRPKRSEEHPTMKPEALVSYCLGNSTLVGGLVLDLFAGSGTTLIAADQLKRRAFLMEIDPRYCDVIRQRYADFTGQSDYVPQ